jgi:hypothetical protein
VPRPKDYWFDEPIGYEFERRMEIGYVYKYNTNPLGSSVASPEAMARK